MTKKITQCFAKSAPVSKCKSSRDANTNELKLEVSIPETPEFSTEENKTYE